MILITGATGHVGNVLAKRLSQMGEQLRLFVLPGDNIGPLNGVQGEIVCGNICNYEDVRNAVKGCDAVFHLAGIVSIGGDNYEFIEKVNVEGTKNVARACLEEGVGRLIYTSSVHAIPEPKQGITINEEIPLDPKKVPKGYSSTKAEAALAVYDMVKRGLDAVVVYPTGIIGPQDYKPSETGRIISSVAQTMRNAAQKKKKKTTFGFQGVYNFVDVRDVTEGMILAWKNGKTGEGYILGGHRVSVPEIYTLVGECVHADVKVINMPCGLVRLYAGLDLLFSVLRNKAPKLTPYAVDVLESNSDISYEKAVRELGYHPRPIQETINDSVEWFEANRKPAMKKYRCAKRRRISVSKA